MATADMFSAGIQPFTKSDLYCVALVVMVANAAITFGLLKPLLPG